MFSYALLQPVSTGPDILTLDSLYPGGLPCVQAPTSSPVINKNFSIKTVVLLNSFATE